MNKNIRKLIYDKYNDSSEKLIDILSEMLKNKIIDVEDMVEIIKLDNNLLMIYRTECEHLNLLKSKQKKLAKNLDNLF
jgi:hypothetical protein